ncbi:preprotein translocase subunit SecG [Epibacterium ulvae]|uniref:preprotein translocase subunit SecG n=1 Tax=Epibacterium ulvae TaxID=1156985 RepID=UPI002492BD8A|nr:preprotein translocase subunit SecG [Epibacterium ulvae]
MENVVLIIHLLLALGLIAAVLLQRSEGGGLGMGGGGGGAVSGRAAATALTKLTWILAIAFIFTSITLTVISAQKSSGSSVFDGSLLPPSDTGTPAAPSIPLGSDLLPPSAADSAPLVPSAE